MSSVLGSLNAGLRRCLERSDRVYLLGEDLLDPYGGAFKVTRGLSSEFPGRVITTPVSEAGIVGVGIGMAMRGYLPVVEIMFGDFLMLAADQILNHASKFSWISGGQVHVPIVIRTPMGGRRGYGPTHSQTLEKHFLGIPGLRTLAINSFQDAGEILETAVLDDPDPILLIENKVLYARQLANSNPQSEFQVVTVGEHYPVHRVVIRGAPEPTVTLLAYGYMAEVACQAMLRLAYESELFAELIVPTQISPFEIEVVRPFARATGRLLVLEEGTRTLGFGAEVIASLRSHKVTCGRVAALDMPVPAAGQLEEKMLPGVEDVIAAAHELCERS
ncbi:MAG: transketolase C-terminal domain-containing protein [Anaerolineales bacterium]|jgi:pyruvate/2-oxoglutarate/acetoin dehydrogenase E1 component